MNNWLEPKSYTIGISRTMTLS